jgi:hypothetical protein
LTDAAPDNGPTDSAPETAVELHFSTVWTDIIDVHCVGCHEPQDGAPLAGFAIGKLDMSSPDAGYANLVNVMAMGRVSFVDGSVACDTLRGAGSIRVVPGNAAESLLYLKVNGYSDAGSPCGFPMPANGEIPDGGQAAVVAEIAAWIKEGALP